MLKLIPHEKPIWIMASAQTGSNYLCDLLNSTNLFQQCPFTEYSNPDWGRRLPDHSPPRYNKYILSHYNHRTLTMAHKILRGLRYVLLTRQDLVGQAVSRHFAFHTKKWHITKPLELKRYQAAEVPYDRDRLWHWCNKIENEISRAEEFLKGKKFMRITYEDTVDSPVDVTLDILKFGNYPLIKPRTETRTHKMWHPMKEEYAKRFRREM